MNPQNNNKYLVKMLAVTRKVSLTVKHYSAPTSAERSHVERKPLLQEKYVRLQFSVEHGDKEQSLEKCPVV